MTAHATAGDAFRAGDIPAAVAAATAGVKAAPTDPGARWLLAEMLLFDGNLERADKVLEAAALREPSWPLRAAAELGLDWRQAPYPLPYTRGAWDDVLTPA